MPVNLELPNPLKDSLRRAGQSHVIDYWEKASETGRTRLLQQLNALDVRALTHSISSAQDFSSLTPPTCIQRENCHAQAKPIGEEAIRNGRCALLTVAGGQGSRLGWEGPKGTLPVTPVRKKSLFQIFAEKIRAAEDLYQTPLHWFIMTSEENHRATVDFFASHDHFGLKQVHFFPQGLVPTMDKERRWLLTPDEQGLHMCADGHGGIFHALRRSGYLDLMEKSGIDTLSYFQVDNPLVRCIDPIFIGLHLLQQSQFSSKIVQKTLPEERVGIFAHAHGQLKVVEYTDLPATLAQARDTNGRLVFDAANVAIHLLDRSFVQKVATDAAGYALPFHEVVRTINTEGGPQSVIKLEQLVFDALPFAHNPLLLEISRQEEFSPIKNATGTDSLATAQNDMQSIWKKWLEQTNLFRAQDLEAIRTLEISPLYADGPEKLHKKLKNLATQPVLNQDVYLG